MTLKFYGKGASKLLNSIQQIGILATNFKKIVHFLCLFLLQEARCLLNNFFLDEFRKAALTVRGKKNLKLLIGGFTLNRKSSKFDHPVWIPKALGLSQRP